MLPISCYCLICLHSFLKSPISWHFAIFIHSLFSFILSVAKTKVIHTVFVSCNKLLYHNSIFSSLGYSFMLWCKIFPRVVKRFSDLFYWVFVPKCCGAHSCRADRFSFLTRTLWAKSLYLESGDDWGVGRKIKTERILRKECHLCSVLSESTEDAASENRVSIRSFCSHQSPYHIQWASWHRSSRS